MCVKEFLGYMCGHCSMPYLRACPVTASNPTFPNCKFPAERPIFTNENCHACERVLWNTEVLRKEEEHRQMHKRQECHCEVMFDAEERERRQRTRGSKGKGKELSRIKYGGAGIADVAGVAGAAGTQGVDGGHEVAGGPGVAGVAGQGRGNDHTDMGTSHSMDEARPTNVRGTWAPDAQMAAYQYVGYHTSGSESGQGPVQQGQGGSELPAGVTTGMVPIAQGGGVGRMDMDFVAGGNGFPVGGGIPREYLWEGQLEIGQPGAGMKWYPQPNEANIPAVSDFYHPSVSTPTKMPRVWQRAMSEPLDKLNYPTSPSNTFDEPVAVDVAVAVPIPNLERQQPAVVSSDMAKL
ncbi:hypothetical protein N431DRAFT_393384 [Stipitochalara longipes BDJ]|nr:hypothetical protein N431DRAFT_393384 [Stipitochalara longipes BDJ]